MSWAFGQTFLACRVCGALIPLAPAVDEPADETGDAARDAQREFLEQHADHQPVLLVPGPGVAESDRPLWDPCAEIRFPLTDGATDYVGVASRASVDEPRTYRLVPGTLAVVTSDVSFDDEILRRGLAHAVSPHPLAAATLDRFIARLHDVASGVTADELEVVFDDADHPDTSIARLPDRLYDALVAASAEVFDDPAERQQVERFLGANRGDDGLLLLRIRRHTIVAGRSVHAEAVLPGAPL